MVLEGARNIVERCHSFGLCLVRRTYVAITEFLAGDARFLDGRRTGSNDTFGPLAVSVTPLTVFQMLDRLFYIFR